MHDQVESRVSRAARAAVNDPWKPIATAPKNGSRVLLFLDQAPDLYKVVVGRFDDARWHLEINGGDQTLALVPTHWMELPGFRLHAVK